MPKPSQFDNYPAGLAARAPYDVSTRATVEIVHDADTVWVFGDARYEQYFFVPIRFRGVNAEELGTPEGDAAFAWLQQLLPKGTPVVIEDSVKVHGHMQDRSFARYVARLILADGTDIGAALVAAGHAVVMER